MQTRSQEQIPILSDFHATGLTVPSVVARVSRNEERLQRRVEELEAQLRSSSQKSLHIYLSEMS